MVFRLRISRLAALMTTGAVLGAILGATAVPQAASAQNIAPGAGGGGGSEPAPISPLSNPDNDPANQHGGDSDSDSKGAAPPAALPGAVHGGEAAPATQAAKDLDPNTALFDAVNRGDLTGAKEALNRGADLKAHNELGQTPIDLAIDLNRNALTFLLLSMRNSGPDDGTGPVVVARSAPAQTGEHKTVQRHGRHLTILAADTRSTGVAARSAPVPQDGGAPKPEIGFLGFGH